VNRPDGKKGRRVSVDARRPRKESQLLKGKNMVGDITKKGFAKSSPGKSLIPFKKKKNLYRSEWEEKERTR